LNRPNIDSTAARAGSDWRAALRDAVRDPAELARLLDLPPALFDDAAGPGGFPLLVPRGFVARMRRGDVNDPLLRQILPVPAETESQHGFGPDPIDEQHLARHGMLQKYPGRALLITTGACPVHCRYCFRRSFPYAAQTAARSAWEPALAELRRVPGLHEVILSGGDPLSLDNDRLAGLIAEIESLPAVRTLRIHTRFPVVLPERVDPALESVLASTRLATVIVLHANHPAELDDTVAGAVARLRGVARLVLNQSVLLADINDDAGTLTSLSERLFECGVLPYYLHLLDRVAGAAHFEVGERKALALLAAMRQRLPGYLVPTLVREIPGELSKTPVV
jgi:EF-P beta-lysylation protein EpmB